MLPLEETSPPALVARFVGAAEKSGCTVHVFNREADALAHLLALLELESAILAWDPADIPLADLREGLRRKGVRVVSGDPDVRIGLTGVDAGLASTGSLVLCSGTGKPRLASLLPPVHIAVLTAEQLFPGLEAWLATMSAGGLEQLGTISTISVISGPSRTGDIGNIPVRGVHGPAGEVHVLLIAPQQYKSVSQRALPVPDSRCEVWRRLDHGCVLRSRSLTVPAWTARRRCLSATRASLMSISCAVARADRSMYGNAIQTTPTAASSPVSKRMIELNEPMASPR